MNSNLNSIIVDGDLTSDPIIDNAKCTFSIKSQRFVKVGDDVVKETSVFDIMSEGKLAQTCFEALKKGRGVRVVGRLKQIFSDNTIQAHEWISKIIIMAEHVEFKPVKPVKGDTVQSLGKLDNKA